MSSENKRGPKPKAPEDRLVHLSIERKYIDMMKAGIRRELMVRAMSGETISRPETEIGMDQVQDHLRAIITKFADPNILFPGRISLTIPLRPPVLPNSSANFVEAVEKEANEQAPVFIKGLIELSNDMRKSLAGKS